MKALIPSKSRSPHRTPTEQSSVSAQSLSDSLASSGATMPMNARHRFLQGLKTVGLASLISVFFIGGIAAGFKMSSERARSDTSSQVSIGFPTHMRAASDMDHDAVPSSPDAASPAIADLHQKADSLQDDSIDGENAFDLTALAAAPSGDSSPEQGNEADWASLIDKLEEKAVEPSEADSSQAPVAMPKDLEEKVRSLPLTAQYAIYLAMQVGPGTKETEKATDKK